jgi:endonuclease YncB( thermonuclease family)
MAAGMGLAAACHDLPVQGTRDIQDVPPPGPVACAPEREALVACTLDGDTLDLLSCGGDAERVRLLGIDAPEIAHGSDPADCYGPEAADGRTLAYLWIEPVPGMQGYERMGAWVGSNNLLLVNEWLLAEGYARLYPVEAFGPVRLQDRLQVAEDDARALGMGLWGVCGDSGR